MSEQSLADYNTINRALNDIDTLDWQLRRQANLAARMLDGRLRSVDSEYHLRRLKKQLRKFNMTTGKWDE